VGDEPIRREAASEQALELTDVAGLETVGVAEDADVRSSKEAASPGI